MRGVSKEHAGISYPVVGLFFMNWYTAHSAVNSDKGALNCRHEYHVRFKMCCKSWELLSCGFDLLFLNRQISVLSQSWLLLYLLLHFVPSKKTLFISVFKVFFYHLIFIARAVIFLGGRGWGRCFRRWDSVPASLFLTKTDVSSVALKQALLWLVCAKDQLLSDFTYFFLRIS